MSSEAPSASWHPAMMPHRDADIGAKLEAADSATPASPSPEADESVQAAPATSRNLLNSSNQSSGADEWFPDYEAGSPWIKENDQPQVEEQGTTARDLDAETLESAVTHELETEQQAAQVAQGKDSGSLQEPDLSQGPDDAIQAVDSVYPEQLNIQEPDTNVAHAQQDSTDRDFDAAPAADIQPYHEEAVREEAPKEQDSEIAPVADVQTPQEAEQDISGQDAISSARLTDSLAPQPEVAEEEEARIPSGPSHISKDSFARTVSEQPNLEDDEDETPWSLPRADTDLFKFMPPNNRTNSFPVVPNLDHHQQHGHVRQLSTVQAEDIINELDQESENLEFDKNTTSNEPGALQQDSFWGDDDTEAAFPAQLGGEIHNPDEEASEARYAEGLPLISHDQADSSPEQGEVKPRDPFADDGHAEEEDFFAQIGGTAEVTDEQEFAPPPLDRNPTMQVVQGLSGGDANGSGAKLESPNEGDEDELLGDEPPVVEQEIELPPLEVTTATENTAPEALQEEQGEDLAAKWSEAFAADEDEDFFLGDDADGEGKEDNAFDPSAFLIDDDEGFLEDLEEPIPELAPAQQPSASASQAVSPAPTGVANKYLPAAPAQPAALSRQPSNPYFPSASPAVPHANQFTAPVPPISASPYGVPAGQPPVSTPYGAPAVRPAVNKGQSFADKSKGGYQSPYDLPMEVVKPRKRPSAQQAARAGPSATPGPPVGTRNSSIAPPPMSGPPGQGPPTQLTPQLQTSGSFPSHTTSNYSGQSPSMPPPSQLPSSKTGFFEELPMSVKPRPVSRTSNKSQPSPSQANFNGPPQASHPSSLPAPAPPQAPSFNDSSAVADIPKLVPPPPTNPYAALPGAANSAPSVLPPPATRYSPASSQVSSASGGVPPPNRYSPAPPVPRAASYGPNPTAQPATLPHLPRTSSPLAHFEARPAGTHSEPPSQLGRVASSLNRVPSLPPTREVEEDDTSSQPATGVSETPGAHFPPRAHQNAPPPPNSDIHNFSPPKRRISYGPVPPGTAANIEPPPRSQTGSPSAMYGLRSPIKASDTAGRPSSAQGHVAPSLAKALSQPDPAPTHSTRPRGLSQKLNLIPPTDGREKDLLQRWKGVPLISWGVGGTLVTSFPVNVPRYGMNQVGPMIVRSPGEVKVKTIKDVQPLEERLAKFPGPLRGKSKKKETVVWLTAGIEELEKDLPTSAIQTQLHHEDKRIVERVLLWKILRILVENDGTLEGNPTVDKAVRDVLSLTPSHGDVASPILANSPGHGGFAGESSATRMQADSVDPGTIQHLKRLLQAGEREKAVYAAADKRLWGHALLIANTVSPDLYHQVSREFIKKEVNFPGHNNESLAALYSVLSGNHEESVDELVPVHARAGVQMVGTSAGTNNGSGMDGLEKWRETLTLILSNRSPGDVQAMNSLGSLLSGYGRAEAAHICFLFARSAAVFGGLDDPRAQFVLVGADHRTQAQQFFKETEPLLLSEVYEYGLSLTGTPSFANGVPHLSVYKLQHAMTLAEHGFRDKALQYCELILKDMSAQTRRSPYHHGVLESAVEDLRQRILQAPGKEGSNSWISKPSMDKVSSSVWSRFNKFVAGDEVDTSGQGSPKLGDESGPFAGLQGGTPTVSRPPSANGVSGMDMFSSPNGYPGAPSLAATTSPVLTRTASRYAPVAAQTPAATSPYNPTASYTPSGRSSMERTSGEYSRGSYEPRRSSELATGPTGSYVPAQVATPADPALGISNNGSYQPASAHPSISTATSAAPPSYSSGPQTPSFSPYTPQSQHSLYAPAPDSTSTYTPAAPVTDDKPAVGDGQPHDYEPSSYGTLGGPPLQFSEVPAASGGYEPPSFQPVTTDEPASSGGYEPPSYQPYGYEPPTYQPDAETTSDDGQARKPKKSFMDDDDDDFPSMTATQTASKSKSQKDKENEELFRKAAEEDAKRAEEQKAAKASKGWGFGGWFGGSKKESLDSPAPNKPIRAKLGEKSSFVYDPDQKRWVNKAAGAEDQTPRAAATPPPPRGGIARAASAMPPPSAGTPPGAGGLAAPPPNQRTVSMPPPSSGSSPIMPGSATPPLMRTASTVSNGLASAPPSRPATSMSNASSIDDLLGAAVPRKGGAKSKKKGGRYVDVMAK